MTGEDEICLLSARCCGMEPVGQLITAGPCIGAPRTGKICDENDALSQGVGCEDTQAAVSGMRYLTTLYRFPELLGPQHLTLSYHRYLQAGSPCRQ